MRSRYYGGPIQNGERAESYAVRSSLFCLFESSGPAFRKATSVDWWYVRFVDFADIGDVSSGRLGDV